MSEILHDLFNPLPNAIMSTLMIVVFLYWIASFLGIGLDDLDLEFGLGVDANVDGDLDVASDTNADTDTDVGTSKDGFFVKVLKFMNVGKVPIMLVFSTLKLLAWIGSLFTTHFLPVAQFGWKSVFILIPIFAIAIFLTRYVTKPLVKAFKAVGYHGEEEIDFMGRSGKMLSTIEGSKLGTAEFLIGDSPMKLTIMSQDGKPLKYHDKVQIVNESDSSDKKVYHVVRDFSIV